jgi:beta-glucosidase
MSGTAASLTVKASDSTSGQTPTFTASGLPAATPLVGYSGLCLDVHADSDAAGTAVDVYICNGTNGQQWSLP